MLLPVIGYNNRYNLQYILASSAGRVQCIAVVGLVYFIVICNSLSIGYPYPYTRVIVIIHIQDILYETFTYRSVNDKRNQSIMLWIYWNSHIRISGSSN